MSEKHVVSTKLLLVWLICYVAALIHVNVIEILEEAATELTAAADKMAATMLLLQVFSNYLPIGFCKF